VIYVTQHCADVGASENAVAMAGDSVVGKVSQESGNHGQGSCQRAPWDCKLAKYIKHSGGAREQILAGKFGVEDEVDRVKVGRLNAVAGQNAGCDGTLQRGETKDAIAVAAQDELDEAVAESADAVVEEDGMHGILTTLAPCRLRSGIGRSDVFRLHCILDSALTDPYRMETAMSAKAAEMMGLLQELALIKDQDAKYESGPKGEAETAEYENRKQRRQAISHQICALGGTAN